MHAVSGLSLSGTLLAAVLVGAAQKEQQSDRVTNDQHATVASGASTSNRGLADAAPGSDSSAAQEPITNPTYGEPKLDPSGRLKVDHGSVFFGPAPKGTHHYATFELTNISSDELRIVQTKTSCGCTKAVISKQGLLPGESADLAVEFEIRGTHAKVVRQTAALFLEGERTPLELEFSGQCLDPLRIRTDQQTEVASSYSAIVESVGGQPFQILDVRPPVLEFSGVASRNHRISLNAVAWREHGHPASAEIKTTLDGHWHSVAIQGRLFTPTQEEPRINVEPSLLDLGWARRGELLVEYITIRGVRIESLDDLTVTTGTHNVAVTIGDVQIVGEDSVVLLQLVVKTRAIGPVRIALRVLHRDRVALVPLLVDVEE
ncbi:MAG: DUF1573 domain-containing protein [Phycisphaerales bacterium]|nr:DUF1573 domain-containing protein [Phycisphaerales bacterium]